MKYAVIESGGKQYKVNEGDILEVDRLTDGEKSDVIFDRVLLTRLDDQVNVGTPLLKNVKVKGKVLALAKREKINVSKFKAKARYRRTTGFRASITKVQITEIVESGVSKN
ncbi:MAG: 50S ribosomal protein L21 [Candidatus Levybacteria bacterium]|nr:50S ribosomal protein L21 [Candidatus Levybacteria bacterium]